MGPKSKKKEMLILDYVTIDQNVFRDMDPDKATDDERKVLEIITNPACDPKFITTLTYAVGSTYLLFSFNRIVEKE